MERLIRRDVENPQVYVSSSIVAISAIVALVAIVSGSPAKWVLAMVAVIACLAWLRSPHGLAAWRKTPLAHRFQSGVLSSEGLLFTRDDGEWQLPWSSFRHYLVSDAGIVLYLPASWSWIAVPRASVRSPEEWSMAVSLVQSSVPAKQLPNPLWDLATAVVLWLVLMVVVLVTALWLVGWWRG
jgi:hypothetical protein